MTHDQWTILVGAILVGGGFLTDLGLLKRDILEEMGRRESALLWRIRELEKWQTLHIYSHRPSPTDPEPPPEAADADR